MNLFDPSEQKFQLYKAIDKIKTRFGHDMITKGTTAPNKPDKSQG
jgi:hypothetical protein